MRNGYTTGTTACAAAYAACLFAMTGESAESISVELPDGSKAALPVFKDDCGFYAIKDGGDDIDATHGMRIYAEVTVTDDPCIIIKGGKGIGRVTKNGLQIPVGEAAINPVPRRMITENLKAVLGSKGAVVTISAPEGEKIAAETFNSKVGIEGGISIIGTTGIVKPMSVEAIIETIKCELDVAMAENVSLLCLTPGKIGEKNFMAEYPQAHTVQMSNYAGEALKYAAGKGFKEIYLCGHPSKLLKILMGYYNTHSKQSPMAVGWLADRLGLSADFNTVEEILDSLNPDLSDLAAELADKIEKDFGFRHVSVIFYDMKGNKHGQRL